MEISELLKLELNPVILKSGEYILVSASYLLETKDNLVSIMTQLHAIWKIKCTNVSDAECARTCARVKQKPR